MTVRKDGLRLKINTSVSTNGLTSSSIQITSAATTRSRLASRGSSFGLVQSSSKHSTVSELGNRGELITIFAFKLSSVYPRSVKNTRVAPSSPHESPTSPVPAPSSKMRFPFKSTACSKYLLSSTLPSHMISPVPLPELDSSLISTGISLILNSPSNLTANSLHPNSSTGSLPGTLSWDLSPLTTSVLLACMSAIHLNPHAINRFHRMKRAWARCDDTYDGVRPIKIV
mmetsp:Transcript_1073/g.1738  ORF Transcript_1073/g.1738 Transcript_1073/m.1738 type:complete len:228 (-) Transcript_1073:592-1275(-)